MRAYIISADGTVRIAADGCSIYYFKEEEVARLAAGEQLGDVLHGTSGRTLPAFRSDTLQEYLARQDMACEEYEQQVQAITDITGGDLSSEAAQLMVGLAMGLLAERTGAVMLPVVKYEVGRAKQKPVKPLLSLARPSPEHNVIRLFLYTNSVLWNDCISIDVEQRNALLRAAETGDRTEVDKAVFAICKEDDEENTSMESVAGFSRVEVELWDLESDALSGGNDCVDLLGFHAEFSGVDWSTWKPEEWEDCGKDSKEGDEDEA